MPPPRNPRAARSRASSRARRRSRAIQRSRKHVLPVRRFSAARRTARRQSSRPSTPCPPRRARAVDQRLFFVVPLATLLVRLVHDAAFVAWPRTAAREPAAAGTPRRLSPAERARGRVEHRGRRRVQNPLFVIVGLDGCRRGSLFRALRLGGFRRRALADSSRPAIDRAGVKKKTTTTDGAARPGVRQLSPATMSPPLRFPRSALSS